MKTEWSVGKIILKWALATPDKTALIIDGQPTTYAELNRKSNRLANALHNAGLKKGDRIAGLTLNTIESICVYIAAAKLGLICVPLNNRLVSGEIRHQLNDSSCRALVFDSQFADSLEPIIQHIGIPAQRMLQVAQSAQLSESHHRDWCTSYEDAVSCYPESEPEPDKPIYLDDALAIIYTSGTTGAPKGAVVTHEQTYFKCFQVILYTDLRQDDRFLTHLPLFHSAGLFIALTPALARGATLVTSRRFDAERFINDCEQHKATVLCAPTTMAKFVLKAYDRSRDSFSSVRCTFGGGEKTLRGLVDELASIGLDLQLGFGQTENSFMALQRKEDTIKHFGSIGRSGFFTDLWIQDGNGNALPPGEIGLITARGPTVMSGYWNLPDETAQTIVDGALNTGDVGYMDEAGNLYLVDREKDMYRSGAENVYPAEIEKILVDHPKIFDVAIIGIPDHDWGETGKAFIVLTPGEQFSIEEMHDYLDGKIARYKLPRHIEYLDELPMTATGKVKKGELKKWELLSEHQAFEPGYSKPPASSPSTSE